MNKKILVTGIVVAAGLITLTAFKTLEQQKQEIAAAITAQLDEIRAQKEEECTMRVDAEAKTRYDAYVASMPVETPKSGKTTTKKKTTTKAPLPQTAPVDPQKQRGGAVQEGNVEEQKKRGGAIPAGDAQQQKQRPGATKSGGK